MVLQMLPNFVHPLFFYFSFQIGVAQKEKSKFIIQRAKVEETTVGIVMAVK
jgi:hypothetical protein